MATETGGTASTQGEDQVADTRRPSLGLGRLVMAAFWVFGAWVTTNAVVDLVHGGPGALGPVLVALFAGIVYLVAALALTHNGRRMRRIGWVCVAVETVGPLLVGLMGVGIPQVSDPRTPWGAFGADYWYIPLVLPVVGLVWLWWSNPRRIVELAEQVERPRHPRHG
ncbi:MAG: hypothetical protein L0L69_07585 [Propionibacterium sp.]|nr:hypothetical protein [Propionibacterium sp.]MDN6566965.1 hypothetical protein [Actinomyces sp.]MDN6794900.1 hypothetical protein [Propionibacterium sp.]